MSGRPSPRRTFSVLYKTALAGCLLFLAFQLLVVGWDWLHKDSVLVSISPETTYLTEPLRADGYVDYLAAINERAAQGVTTENNAVVVLWQAAGCREIADQHRAAYFRLLGTEIPVEQGPLLSSFWEYASPIELSHPTPEQLAAWHLEVVPPAAPSARKDVADNAGADEGTGGEDELDDEQANQPAATSPRSFTDRAADQWDESLCRPWTDEEFPLVAQFVDEQEPAFDLLMAGARRPRYFAPRTAPSAYHTFRFSHAMAEYRVRAACELLICRAMRSAGQRDFPTAIASTLAALQWGQKLQQDANAINVLIGCRQEAAAYSASVELAAANGIAPQELKQLAQGIREPNDSRPMKAAFAWSQRIAVLEETCDASRHGPRLSENEADKLSLNENRKNLRTRISADWNLMLREVNATFDSLDAALTPDRFLVRNAALIQWGLQCDRLIAVGQPVFLNPAPTANASTRSMLCHCLGESMLDPSLALKAEDHTRQMRQLTGVMLAVCLYRAETGLYPPDLQTLIPAYLPHIPVDLYQEKPLVYKVNSRPATGQRTAGQGILLYSVGPDGIDDRGHSEASDPPGDDVSLKTISPQS